MSHVRSQMLKNVEVSHDYAAFPSFAIYSAPCGILGAGLLAGRCFVGDGLRWGRVFHTDPHSDPGSRAGRRADTDSGADANPHANADIGAYSHPHPYPNPVTHAYSYPDAYPYSHAHTYTDSHTDSGHLPDRKC